MIGWLALLACATPPRPDVLLVTLDTTRADALGAYGRSPSPSPRIDALAASGLRFDEALTPAPLTLPAHTAILTGRHPGPLGLRRNGVEAVPEAVDTLAERLRAAGYHTGAFVGAVVLDGAFGLDQGFDTYEDGFDLTGPDADQGLVARWTGGQVGDRAQAWLLDATRDPAPVFLWMHLYDAHLPHDPANPRAGATGDSYLDAIAAMDDQVGHLLALHATLGRGAPLVVVAGDHGEGRGDHGEATHGYYAYRSTLRVPLVVAGPGVSPGTVPTPVSLVDVTPTVLRLLDLPADGVDGVALGDGHPPPRPIFGEAWTSRDTFGLAPLRVIQDDVYRYIDAPRPELYRWRDDPGEVVDLGADATRLAPALVAAVASGPYATEGGTGGGGGALPAASAALTALGYLAGPPPAADRGDPKDWPDLEGEVERAVDAARRNPPGDGARMLERFLAERREVPHVRLALARAYLAAGEPLRASAALAPLRATAPDDPGLATFDAQLHLLAGDHAAAERLARAALAAAPNAVPAWAILAEALRQAGRTADAVAAADAGLAVSPDTSSVLLARAVLDVDAGKLADALPRLRAAVAHDPKSRDGLLLLGVTSAATGHPEEALPLLARREALYGEDAEGTAALARCTYVLGRFDEAIPRATALAAAEPDEPEWRRLLADALLRVGRRAEGATHLARLRALAPTDPDLPALEAAYGG